MKNPLLNSTAPLFYLIKPKHVLPALKEIIAANQNSLREILADKNPVTWQNLMLPLENMDARLSFVWSQVSHLNGVKNSEFRQVYEKALPILTAYRSSLAHQPMLYPKVVALLKDAVQERLDVAQRRALKNFELDLRLAGAMLNRKDQKRFAVLEKKIAALHNRFARQVLDATYGWHYLVQNELLLKGLPAYAVAAAKQKATAKKKSGFWFDLAEPTLQAVTVYADNRALRKKFYHAYVTRAPQNAVLIGAIMQLRQEMALLLGFKNYAAFSLARKMAKSEREVFDFLYALAKGAKSQAKQELQQLKEFAKQNCGIKKLEPWDVAYVSEKLSQRLYGIEQLKLRDYFPEVQVLSGLFTLAERLFGIKIVERHAVKMYHQDARVFKILDRSGKMMAEFYLDLYARPGKRGGAWMDECKVRRVLSNGKLILPSAYLVCNLNPPAKGKPALFTLSEIDVIFHEFGHVMQHLLTKVDCYSVSGIRGVPWDAVEFPSQFFEEWCFTAPVLKMLSAHVAPGKKLPDELIAKIIASHNYQSGLKMLRQLEFALFDFHLHTQGVAKITSAQAHKIFNSVRAKVRITPYKNFDRSENSFLHIFTGDYAAGYYSYKWAEVLAADAFEVFKRRGLFDRKTGNAFLHNVLAVGGAVDPLIAFKNFCGHKPKVNALLKLRGLACENRSCSKETNYLLSEESWSA